jgi:hypothetical protein
LAQNGELTISGTPTAVGTYTYTATASYTGRAMSVSTTGVLVVWPVPTVTLPAAPSSVYENVETGVQEWRAPIPIVSLACNTLIIRNLPSGLTVADAPPAGSGEIELPPVVGATLSAMRTVYIHGTPTLRGEYTYEVEANNRATQRAATATGKIGVNPTPAPEIAWADSTLTVWPVNPSFPATTTKPAFTLDGNTYTTTVTGTPDMRMSRLSLRYTIQLPTRFGIKLSAANGDRQLGVGDPLMSDFSLNERTMTIKWEGTLAAPDPESQWTRTVRDLDLDLTGYAGGGAKGKVRIICYY